MNPWNSSLTVNVICIELFALLVGDQHRCNQHVTQSALLYRKLPPYQAHLVTPKLNQSSGICAIKMHSVNCRLICVSLQCFALHLYAVCNINKAPNRGSQLHYIHYRLPWLVLVLLFCCAFSSSSPRSANWNFKYFSI